MDAGKSGQDGRSVSNLNTRTWDTSIPALSALRFGLLFATMRTKILINVRAGYLLAPSTTNRYSTIRHAARSDHVEQLHEAPIEVRTVETASRSSRSWGQLVVRVFNGQRGGAAQHHVGHRFIEGRQPEFTNLLIAVLDAGLLDPEGGGFGGLCLNGLDREVTGIDEYPPRNRYLFSRRGSASKPIAASVLTRLGAQQGEFVIVRVQCGSPLIFRIGGSPSRPPTVSSARGSGSAS